MIPSPRGSSSEYRTDLLQRQANYKRNVAPCGPKWKQTRPGLFSGKLHWGAGQPTQRTDHSRGDKLEETTTSSESRMPSSTWLTKCRNIGQPSKCWHPPTQQSQIKWHYILTTSLTRRPTTTPSRGPQWTSRKKWRAPSQKYTTWKYQVTPEAAEHFQGKGQELVQRPKMEQIWEAPARTTNARVTWKPDNTIKGIWNPIPQKPNNPLKGIQNLVPNGIRSQWLRGLTILT